MVRVRKRPFKGIENFPFAFALLEDDLGRMHRCHRLRHRGDDHQPEDAGGLPYADRLVCSQIAQSAVMQPVARRS